MEPNINKGKFKTCHSCSILLLLTINVVFHFLGGGEDGVKSGGSVQELRLRKIN